MDVRSADNTKKFGELKVIVPRERIRKKTFFPKVTRLEKPEETLQGRKITSGKESPDTFSVFMDTFEL